jgi:hypothetical protein
LSRLRDASNCTFHSLVNRTAPPSTVVLKVFVKNTV